MNKWLIYLKERSPLPVLLLLATGMIAYPMLLIGKMNWFTFLGTILINVFIFIMMRLGDELKDFEKDKIMNPTRPLPRGLILVSEMQNLFYAIYLILIIASGILLTYNKLLGFSMLAVTSTLAYLMYKEFYYGHKLEERPFLYALTHQIIVFPLYAWAGLTYLPELKGNELFLLWVLANFGTSFTYEICRKLDPNAHELAKTYAHHYGRPVTVIMCLILILIFTLAATQIGIGWIVIPMAALLILSLLKWLNNPESFKAVEGLAALLSLVTLWGPSLRLIYLHWSL
jgi:4-hydroxybenzoate polyprenyltransferase